MVSKSKVIYYISLGLIERKYFVIFSKFIYRTKWKRQNQLRLEQLRHQANLEKELISGDHSCMFCLYMNLLKILCR